MEAKKTNFEMAEYDHAFIDRIMDMRYEDILAYLQTLSDLERKAMEEAILRAVSQRAVQYHIEQLSQ